MFKTLNDMVIAYSKGEGMKSKGEPSVDLKIVDQRIKENFPAYQTAGSAGIDLCACLESSYLLYPDETILIDTGIALHIADPDYAGFILPRSGLGHKKGIVLGNLVGLIDSDYQGTIKVSLWNRSKDEYQINPMDRIAQLVIMPVQQVHFNVVSSFDESERGEGGFGSTGVITN